MTTERDLLRDLQTVLASAEVDIASLVEGAWEDARDEVRSTLTRLMANDLLRRSLAALQAEDDPSSPPADGRSATSPATTEQNGVRDATPAGVDGEVSATDDARGDPPRATSPSEDDAQRPAELGTYVFGVVGAEATLPTDPLPALPGGGPVRLLSTSGPQAVVCDVDPEAFAVLREPTPDGLELLGEAANVHDQVVTGFVDGPVLPLGLGTVLPDDDAVIDLLTRHAESLDGELERIRGCGEWALTVHEAVPLARAEPAAPAAASGREYLQQRRAALDERDTRWQEQEHVAERIHTPLADLSLDAVTVAARPLEDADPPLLHAVYLVADSSHERFLATADAIAEEHPTLAVELTGPWPPYHFTALDLSDDAVAS